MPTKAGQDLAILSTIGFALGNGNVTLANGELFESIQTECFYLVRSKGLLHVVRSNEVNQLTRGRSVEMNESTTIDGWMDGWMDGCICRWILPTINPYGPAN